MKIYHYTSIETLALILSSKKLRFTRLDLLDDRKEVNGAPPKKHIGAYVSCWTENKEESIAQWSLYTNMKGIRIEMDKEFYHIYEHGENRYKVHSPIHPNHLGINGNIIVPPLLENPKGFYTKVEYWEDFKEKKRAGFRTWDNVKTRVVTLDYTPETYDALVKYKDPIWKFQEETRFFIVMLPCGKRLPKFYDMEIKQVVLDNIRVRLNPDCSKSDNIIVSSLLKEFTRNGSVKLSNLHEVYRKK